MHLIATTAACPPELLEVLQQARCHTDALQPFRQLSWDSGRSVTLSRCNASGRMVVVKTHCRADSTQLQQVLSEAQIHSRLTPSPHISQLLVAAQDSRQVVIVMEYAEGGTLRDNMCGLSEERLRDWVARPLLLALAKLQQQGIVHRDVKPENVLIHNDELLLTDFGLAACIAPAPAPGGDSCSDGSPGCSSDDDSACSASRCSSSSGSGQASHRSSIDVKQDSSLTACGTPMYTAPEVLLAMFRSQPLRGVVTPKNDVWSLGLILLEALTGSHPFSAEACAAAGGNVLYSIAHHKTVALPETLGPDFRDFLTQALQRDPERRPTAAQLLRHPWLSTGTADADAELSCSPRLRARSNSDSGLPDAGIMVQVLGGVVPRSLSNGTITAADEPGAIAIASPLSEVRGLQHALSDPHVLAAEAEVLVAKAAAARATAPAVAPLVVEPDVPQGQCTAFEMAMSWED